MEKELDEFVYNDGEVLVGATKAGTMLLTYTVSAFRQLLALPGSSRENRYTHLILSWRMRWPLKQTWR